MIISNAPIPGSGILAKITEKTLEFAVDKVTELLQDKVTEHYDDRAAQKRERVKEVTQGFEQNTVLSNGLASLYTYRLQNLLPYLTEKSLKDLSTRLSVSVISYLEDKKRLTNPDSLTQLSVMSFYHNKEMTLGDVLSKARGQQGLKKTDGRMLSYGEVFGCPLIETTDGAQYHVWKGPRKREGEKSDSLIQIVPLIEREILQDKKLQTKQTELQEKRLPQMSPFQVEIIKEKNDIDYARRAIEFVASLQ